MHLTPDRLLLLICMLLASGALLWIGLAGLLAWAILHPPRMGAGKAIYYLRRLSPGDLGLNYEEQSFSVRDARTGRKLHIAGWWIPAGPATTRTAILIHGYADAKVGSIAWAPLLNHLNFNILAIDLRAHGESGGRFCTGGFFERDDISQLIDQLRAVRTNQSQQLILFGASLGASVAAGVAADRRDISAVILESPYNDYERVIEKHFRLRNLPAGPLLKAAVAMVQKVSGAKFRDIRTADLISRCECPAQMIIGTDDPLVDEADIAAMKNTKAAIWLVENAGHLDAMPLNPDEYQRRIEQFLSNALS